VARAALGRDDAAMPEQPRRRAAAAADERFDRAYYDRFYRDPDTRVSDAQAVGKLAALVAAWTAHLDLPVRTILDVGCGLGHWRAAAKRRWPRAAYFGVERSRHLCDELGWTQGSIVDFDPAAAFGAPTFDLVVCQGVLQYLDDDEADAALANLARWTDGALYLEALTRTDWRERCDRDRTDGAVRLRTGAWHRRRLRPAFTAVGGGVFVARRAGCTFFELETP
jgi:SAM-dependent methyltransferase